MDRGNLLREVGQELLRAVPPERRGKALIGALRAIDRNPMRCLALPRFVPTLWELVEETLNDGADGLDAEAMEHACAMLEQIGG